MNVRSQFSQRLVVLMAAAGLLGSQVLLPAAQVVSSTRAVDVALSAQGSLSGSVVDARGHSRGKTVVEVRRGRRLVARTLSDDKGLYTIANLPGGLYQVRVDGSETLIRAWAEGTAPRSAAGRLQIIANAPIIRGQAAAAPPTAAAGSSTGGIFGGAGMSAWMTTALVVGGVVGAIVVIDVLDDDDEDSPPASP
jgi:hypothetical protein